MADYSMTEASQLDLPQELVLEAKRQPKPKNDQFRVEGWHRSWLSRISELLVGSD
jgi:hypothetical protein